MNSEEQIEEKALLFVKEHSREVIKRFCGSCRPVSTPVSLFMAGSPGAGKTEVSRGLVKRFETVPVRIDADEVRASCPGYLGANAHLFQKAATKGVHILYDYALKHNLHLILDGTFSYGDALKNIQRSLSRERKVELWFVYQDPTKAWEFTRAREAEESRHVTKEAFIRGFLMSQANTIEAKKTFGNSLVLNLLVKNIDNSDGQLQLNIKAQELDRYIGAVYTENDLEKLLLP